MAAANIISDDLNYEQWAPNVKTKLAENGVWDVVVNGVPPDPTKTPELSATITVVDLARWRDLAIKDMQALKILQSSLPDSTFRSTFYVASAKDLWDLLRKGNEETTLCELENEFQELSMYEREEPMDIYLARVMDIVERFRRLGIAKSDDEVIKKLLSSLSRSYDDAIPVLEDIMNLEDMTLKDLLDVLEFFGYYPETTIPNMLKDFYVGFKKVKSEQMWCGMCKLYNHNQEDCYYNPVAGNSSGGATQAEIDPVRNANPEHLMLAVSRRGFTFDEDMWMLYTNASNHMTPYVKYFTSLDRTYRGRVGIAGRRVIMAEGRGDVSIVMKGVRKTIKNVLFVPGLNRNVLSVGQMTSRGYTVIMEAGECTIKDETGKVFPRTVWVERGIGLRLQVIEGNLTS